MKRLRKLVFRRAKCRKSALTPRESIIKHQADRLAAGNGLHRLMRQSLESTIIGTKTCIHHRALITTLNWPDYCRRHSGLHSSLYPQHGTGGQSHFLRGKYLLLYHNESGRVII